MRHILRRLATIAAVSGAFAYALPAAATAATATPSASPAPSTATCGPDGQVSMSQNTDLFSSQTSAPGHTVYSTTVIVNNVGRLPGAEIRLQVIPEMQGVTRQPPLPRIEWSLDGGGWHNPQVAWTTDADGTPYWIGPDLAVGTLTTGTHKLEVGFTFAAGDLYVIYGADVYLDADKCSVGGELATYGSGYVSAAFDGPAPGTGSGGSGGSGGGGGSSSKSTSGPASSSGAQEPATRSSAPSSPAPSSSATQSAAAAAASASADHAPSTAGAQPLAAQKTAAGSSSALPLTLGLILVALFALLALGGFTARGRRLRVRAEGGTGRLTDPGDGGAGQEPAE